MVILQYILASVFIALGIVILALAVFGIFKFDYCLNRMHAAAMVDTGAVLCIFLGLIILYGFSWASFKILIILLCLWMGSPVCSHLIVQMELTLNEDEEKDYEVRPL